MKEYKKYEMLEDDFILHKGKITSANTSYLQKEIKGNIILKDETEI